MEYGFVARVVGGLVLSLATSLVPAAVAREDGTGRPPEVRTAATVGQSEAIDLSNLLFQVAPPGALPLDQTLVARVEGLGLTNSAFIEGNFAGQTGGWDARTQGESARSGNHLGLPLPQPGRFTAVLATLALGLFFFLRRIV